jgi:hypothetical protein
LRDHVEKGDIEMKYIDTEWRLADIFTKPLDELILLLCRRNLLFAIPIAWFEGELVFYLVYTLSLLHRIAFHLYLLNITLFHLL